LPHFKSKNPNYRTPSPPENKTFCQFASESLSFQINSSKIENRSDIRLSTLIDYMKSIGMGIKIMGIPKNDDEDEFEILTAKAK